MFLHDLEARKLPPVIPENMDAAQWPAYRKQLIELFASEEYGRTPLPPKEVRSEILPFKGQGWAGKAEEYQVKLSFDTPKGEFSFPVSFVMPESGEQLPLVIYISFRPYPDAYHQPVEEIIDSGVALAAFCYEDVTSDDGDMANGLAGMFEREDGDSAAWGKIGMWAYAASRVMDYARTLEAIDEARIFVAGHSRLGKTALWCAAQDERFAGAGINGSGCGGMAVTRGKQGETVKAITQHFPHWFCENYQKYAGRESEMPVDQHQLAALLAPRLLAVSNAEEDIWADPQSEFMALYEADKAYTLLGVPGLIAPAEYPAAGTKYPGGCIGYGLRRGRHFMSREDWGFFLKFWGMHT